MTESPSFVAAQVTPVQSVFRAPRSEPCACGQPPCRPEIALRFLFHPFLGIQLTYSTSLQRSCFLLLRRSQARDTSFPKLGAVLGSLGPGPGCASRCPIPQLCPGRSGRESSAGRQHRAREGRGLAQGAWASPEMPSCQGRGAPGLKRYWQAERAAGNRGGLVKDEVGSWPEYPGVCSQGAWRPGSRVQDPGSESRMGKKKVTQVTSCFLGSNTGVFFKKIY